MVTLTFSNPIKSASFALIIKCKNTQKHLFFKATHSILEISQIGDLEMKEGIVMLILYIETLRSEQNLRI